MNTDPLEAIIGRLVPLPDIGGAHDTVMMHVKADDQSGAVVEHVAPEKWQASRHDISIGPDTIKALYKLVGHLSADEMMRRGLSGVEVQLVKAVIFLAPPTR